MKNTVESFWLMLINNNSRLIVTLSSDKEDGRVNLINRKEELFSYYKIKKLIFE